MPHRPAPALNDWPRPQKGKRAQARCSTQRRRCGHSRLSARPPITSAAASSFQPGSDSPSQKAEAPMPNTGTSSAMGVTVAAG